MQFPTLPTRPSAPTGTYTVDYSGGITATVAANQTIYLRAIDNLSQSMPGMFFIPPWGSPAVMLEPNFAGSPPFDPSTLNNAGKIWNFSDIYSALGTRWGHINNSGWIIAESVIPLGKSGTTDDTGRALAVTTFASLQNSGTIVALASGIAVGASGMDLATVSNTGTIAAKATPTATPEAIGGLGSATALTMGVLSQTLNAATGVIYAEGPWARGITFTRGTTDYDQPLLTNHGLIEAAATQGGQISTAIYAAPVGLWGEFFLMDNYGTIRADRAIFGASETGELFVYSLPQFNTDVVRNHAGGLIDGDVILQRGDDIIENAGTITGYVNMGEGWDLFDNTGGLVNGVVDLSHGNDLYVGSANADVARGGLGNDDLSGGAGKDLLLGDGNDDVLEGQGGNDGLYGGTGDDWLITLDGDFAAGGLGDDLITTGDYAFARIDGGEGHDIWELAAGTRALDLAIVADSGRVTDIDQLHLGSGKTLTIRAADVAALTDVGWMGISGAAGSTIYLPETWVAGANITIDGHGYRVFTLGGAELVIDADATINLAAPPTPGGGLDAISPGGTAPVPGSVEGSALVDEIDTNDFMFGEDIVIDWDTVVHVTDGDWAMRTFGLATAFHLENFGAIVGEGVNGAKGYYDGFVSALDNQGLIKATSDGAGAVTAVQSGNSMAVYNSGFILADAGAGQATAVHLHTSSATSPKAIVNDGQIQSLSTSGRATAIYMEYASGAIDNTSVIAASGADGAIGLDLTTNTGSVTVANSGYIIAEAGATATGPEIGIRMNDGTVDNQGLIEAALAVYFDRTFGAPTLLNSGEIKGNIETGQSFYGLNLTNSAGGEIDGNILIRSASPFEGLGSAPSTVVNRGTITGDIRFGEGNDVFDNRGGTHIGTVFGGIGADFLYSGLGNDKLDGGVGVDTAVVAGNRSAYTVTQTAFGVFSVLGPDGSDTLSGVEYLKFDDQTLRLRPGSGTSVNFSAAPSTYMSAIRDFDGNNLGGSNGWLRIGSADVNGDGDVDQILVNKTISRFAEVGTAPDGLVYFGDYGWAGETRVVGIYIDPLVQSGQVVAGSDHDSQRRLQNDLFIENINRVLGAGDYDHDGLQEVYFGLTDGTAYLHAYMHADGNIRYANYQSQQQVIDFLATNGWAASTYDGWFV